MSITVKEYALRQLHWMIQKDPWVQEIFLAAGITLDQLAERILAIYDSRDFDRMRLAQVRYYERLLALSSDESAALEDRRASIQAAWNVAQKPTLETIQSICDSWKDGGIIVHSDPGSIAMEFIGDVGIPSNLDALIASLEQTIPAHISISYDFRYLLIKEIHGVVSLSQMENIILSNLAGGA